MTADTIDPGQTLGALVAERPLLADAFERLHLDYCCDGNQSLAEACGHRGLDPDTVAVLLERLADTAGAGRLAPHDLRGATVEELCDHIVTVHHARLRRELPRIAELLATVVRVHGKQHAELHDVERLFTALSRDLLDHVESEEARLFPAVLGSQAGNGVGSAAGAGAGSAAGPGLRDLVAEHTAEHTETGDALAALRELSGGYDVGRAFCGTHRSLLEALQAFELDLHQHVHEENNILFPRLAA